MSALRPDTLGSSRGALGTGGTLTVPPAGVALLIGIPLLGGYVGYRIGRTSAHATIGAVAGAILAPVVAYEAIVHGG